MVVVMWVQSFSFQSTDIAFLLFGSFLFYGPFGLGEGEGEQSRVDLTQNQLIFSQHYYTPLHSPSFPPLSKQAFNLWIWCFCYLGFDFFVVWVLISILLGFKPKITCQFRPTQPMTCATRFNPNIPSAAGPFSIHPIRSDWLQVNHKPNPTRPVDSPNDIPKGQNIKIKTWKYMLKILCLHPLLKIK